MMVVMIMMMVVMMMMMVVVVVIMLGRCRMILNADVILLSDFELVLFIVLV